VCHEERRKMKDALSRAYERYCDEKVAAGDIPLIFSVWHDRFPVKHQFCNFCHGKWDRK
jgi:hypothetical protein